MDTMLGATPESKHKLLGPIIGIGVILLVLVLGGFYLWGSMLTEEAVEKNILPRQKTESNAKTTPAAASDDLSALEKDVQSDLPDTEKDLGDIDKALVP